MPTVTFLGADGLSYLVAAKAGESLMRAAVLANVPGIDADCGGCCSCATCHVYIEEPGGGSLPAPSADESAMLEAVAAERRSNSRLSCQIELTESMCGLVASIPSRQA